MDRASPCRPAPGLSRYGYAVPAARVGSAASDGTNVGHEGTCRVLVTIPVRNEVQRLEGTIEELDAAFEQAREQGDVTPLVQTVKRWWFEADAWRDPDAQRQFLARVDTYRNEGLPPAGQRTTREDIRARLG